jgi:hypothetical protein
VVRAGAGSGAPLPLHWSVQAAGKGGGRQVHSLHGNGESPKSAVDRVGLWGESVT